MMLYYHSNLTVPRRRIQSAQVQRDAFQEPDASSSSSSEHENIVSAASSSSGQEVSHQHVLLDDGRIKCALVEFKLSG